MMSLTQLFMMTMVVTSIILIHLEIKFFDNLLDLLTLFFNIKQLDEIKSRSNHVKSASNDYNIQSGRSNYHGIDIINVANNLLVDKNYVSRLLEENKQEKWA